MVGIPHALDSDTEDVVWALQTAEALWKRAERADALVWLRRAAQAAGEAEDDDRALALARQGADLADWMTRHPAAAGPASSPSGSPPPPVRAPTRPPADSAHDPVRVTMTDEVEELVEIEMPVESAQTMPELPSDAEIDDDVSPSPAEQRVAAAEPAALRDAPPAPSPRTLHAASAAEKHAGRLDPWAEGDVPAPPRLASQDAASANPPGSPLLTLADYDGVITSAPKVPSSLEEAVPPSWLKSPPSSRRLTSKPPAASATTGADLTGIEAFADVPDDALHAFGEAAVVHELTEEEEVAGFALALILSGTADLAAAIVDTPVQPFTTGDVVRARGTIERVTAVRLVGHSGGAKIATWDERAIATAFKACPWVEDDLLAAGDRLQAMVGVTMGPLGERLDPEIRAAVLRRLTLRVLAAHEVLASRGKPVPGLLVVGAGEIELVDGAGVPDGTVFHPGDFLFPHEALRAATAPTTARATNGGALVLFAERGLAQELLVTCPPLLEVFAGM